MTGKAKRAQYTLEFKLEAVRLVKNGQSLAAAPVFVASEALHAPELRQNEAPVCVLWTASGLTVTLDRRRGPVPISSSTRPSSRNSEFPGWGSPLSAACNMGEC